jgi:hypothetical protein
MGQDNIGGGESKERRGTGEFSVSSFHQDRFPNHWKLKTEN